MPVRLAIAAAITVALAVPAAAQIKPRVIQLVPIELENGKVVAVQPRMMAVTNATGERWGLQISNEAVVRVLGEAESDMLQLRQFVRVVATVDKRQSKVKEKVKSITLTVPAKDPDRMPGVFYPGQEGGGDLTPPAKGPPQPKAAPPAGSPAPVKPPRLNAKAKDREPGKDGRDADNEELLDVRGYIVKINKKKDQLSLEVPNAPFKSPLSLELDPDVKISIDLLDYSLAKPGDRVSARGFQISPQIMDVRELGVVLSASLTTKKRPSPKSIAKQPAPRGKPAGQEPFEAAGPDGKSKPADPPGKETPAAKEQPPGKEPPAADADLADKILPALSLKPEELKGKASLSIAFEAGNPLLFIPAKEEPIENIRKQFGNPKEVQNVQGSLPVGEEGARKDVRWQVWTYGTLKIFVDETGKTRYFHLGKK